MWVEVGPYATGLGPNVATRNPFDTMMVNHSGHSQDPTARCYKLSDAFPQYADADTACVWNELSPGTPSGNYSPVNTCQSVVERALARCQDMATRTRSDGFFLSNDLD